MGLPAERQTPSFACMDHGTTYTRYGKGSTGVDTAFPAQRSGGGSAGVPRRKHTPSLRKPAVLATSFPEPPQGTHGTAISAGLHHPGPALPRLQCSDGGTEQTRPTCRRWLTNWVQAKVTRWRTQIRRYYPTRMSKHVALVTHGTFRYIRLIGFIVRIPRRILFRSSALPFGVVNRFVHDCRFAGFRRRAVCL